MWIEMHRSTPIQVCPEVLFGLLKRTLRQLHHATVCPKQKRRREDTSLLCCRFFGFDGLKSYGIQSQLQSMLVKDVGFLVALRNGVNLAGGTA